MTTFRLVSYVQMLGFTLVVLHSVASAQAPDVAMRCFGCHTENGVTENPNIPTIAGIGDFYIENQLKVFAAKARPCLTDFLMDAQVVDKCELIGALSENQRSEIVQYFAELEFEPLDQPVDGTLAEWGAAIHSENCERCHTNSGRESRDDSAILAGQPIPYLTRQLINFRAGKRWQLDSMARETEDLEDDEIDALANFYAGVAQ